MPSLRAPHVLIVDDEREVRDMLSVFFAAEGFTTECAIHGADALERLRAHRPCLVLLDLVMPVMHGWAFRVEQLEDATIADVPVVCMTGIVDRDLVESRLQLTCLQKPLDFDALLHLARRMCAGA